MSRQTESSGNVRDHKEGLQAGVKDAPANCHRTLAEEAGLRLSQQMGLVMVEKRLSQIVKHQMQEEQCRFHLLWNSG